MEIIGVGRSKSDTIYVQKYQEGRKRSEEVLGNTFVGKFAS